MLEQQAPHCIQPAYEQTAECNDYRGNQCDDVLGLKESRPSYANLDNPVNKRDYKQNNLNKTALLIKPCSHKT